MVFDALAKTSSGSSLNDIQNVGPRLQKDLLDILMNYRTGRIAISVDIVKMFRQVKITSKHWNLQRILWRENPEEPRPRDYWLTVVTYGMASSPYLACRTLIQCAIDNETEWPVAAQVVQIHFYMDDLLTSVEDERRAVNLKGEVIALLKNERFGLAKWCSNCKEIANNCAKDKNVNEQDSTSLLGVWWNPREDEFRFKVQNRSQPEVLTKRIITSEAARIFEPQGYVAPVTMRAKLFIQELTRMIQYLIKCSKIGHFFMKN